MILAKLWKNSPKMQNLGQLGPENCMCFLRVFCLFVCFVLFCFFFLLFFFPPPLFFFFFFTHRLIWICTYIPYCTISVSKIQTFQLLSFCEDESPSDTPCVCKHEVINNFMVQACNWRWRSTKSSPNVEDGCTDLCSFGVLAVQRWTVVNSV